MASETFQHQEILLPAQHLGNPRVLGIVSDTQNQVENERWFRMILQFQPILDTLLHSSHTHMSEHLTSSAWNIPPEISHPSSFLKYLLSLSLRLSLLKDQRPSIV